MPQTGPRIKCLGSSPVASRQHAGMDFAPIRLPASGESRRPRRRRRRAGEADREAPRPGIDLGHRAVEVFERQPIAPGRAPCTGSPWPRRPASGRRAVEACALQRRGISASEATRPATSAAAARVDHRLGVHADPAASAASATAAVAKAPCGRWTRRGPEARPDSRRRPAPGRSPAPSPSGSRIASRAQTPAGHELELPLRNRTVERGGRREPRQRRVRGGVGRIVTLHRATEAGRGRVARSREHQARPVLPPAPGGLTGVGRGLRRRPASAISARWPSGIGKGRLVWRST